MLDAHQNRGIGREIRDYLVLLARKNGIQGFMAQVLENNMPALKLMDHLGTSTKKQVVSGIYEFNCYFNRNETTIKRY